MAENALGGGAKPGWGAGLSTVSTAAAPAPASPRKVTPSKPSAQPVAAKAGSQSDPYRAPLHREERSKGYPNGQHAKPTKASLQDRSGSPDAYNTSGIERAMAKLADKTHKPVFKGRRK